jgi:hypothetical protein
VVKIACTIDRSAMSLSKTSAASCAGMSLVILLATGITTPDDSTGEEIRILYRIHAILIKETCAQKMLEPKAET